ncbi:MAG TPA: NADH-ubiquinone oxidoreductase-F iron-sulfur binding region domain-containing protein [Urbifossiella sp.]|nr:NADH-ubiquinone oxidoreductase-F iron-sulfur binding region domain-containing protein [Urbifossiella sp.]
MIVQQLRAIQNRFGYLPDAELVRLASDSGVAQARIEEVASFFPGFRQERDRPAAIEVRVCRDMTCHHLGSPQLLTVAADPKLQQLLEANAPRWSEQAGRKPLPSALCRVQVEGVSCLGRCDRAPAVWVERSPMPDGEHAWVFAKTSEESLEEFRQRLEVNIGAIAAGEAPVADADAAYEPSSNAHWEMDPYRRKERSYDAVRKIAEFLKRNGGLPQWTPQPGKKIIDILAESHPILAEFQASGLQGMGGAGVLAFTKWSDVWQQPGREKYVVANGDESEPGTFKDRELMLRLPHLVVEGMIVAGLLTGAAAGFIYVRHEYFEQIHALEEEIRRAELLGMCGNDVLGTGIAFPLRVVESPGGYICGEQSALIEAMEDRRAQPRNRPPELASNGFRDKPTAVNNVETLAWAPFIVLNGGARYAASGWRSEGPPSFSFKGRRLLSVSGDVNRSGVFEVPIGISFGELIDDPQYCGGMLGGKALKAIAPSGPSSGLMPASIPIAIPIAERYDKWLADAVSRLRTSEERAVIAGFAARHLPPGATSLDIRALPLDLSFFRNVNGLLKLPAEAMLGAGITVFAEGADILDLAVNFTRFFRNESCGKCVPCRIGSQKLYQIGFDLLAKRKAGTLTRQELLGESKDDPTSVKADVKLLGDVLQPTSICGLGYVAPIPLGSALAYFGPEIAEAAKGFASRIT